MVHFSLPIFRHLFAGASILVSAQSALAQTVSAQPVPGEEADADAGSLGDIVVTAQKRETLLQKTPASISAVGEATLLNAQITGINDLTKAVPGLVVTDSGPGQRRISLRGIRSSGEPQVAIYYDEAPLAGAPGTTSDSGGNQGDLLLFDVQRVEVLRGPQGTLYGSSSMGGTVRVITRKPDFNLAAAFDVTGSNTAHAGGQNYAVNAMVNVPIIDGLLAARAVYYRRQNAGWIDNPVLGNKDINKEEGEGGRLLLRFTPAPWLTIDAAAHISDTTGAPPIWAPSLGKYISPNRVALDFYDRNRLYSTNANADIGFATLVLAGSYQDRDSKFIRDPYYRLAAAKNSTSSCVTHFTAATCATPAGMAAFNSYVDTVTPVSYSSPETVKNTTGEARLQSNGDGFLSWTVGAYWSKRKSHVASDGVLVDGRGQPRNAEPLVYTRQVDDELRQKAAFGEVAVRPFDGLTLTGGLRYYNYKRSVAGDTQKGFDLINFAIQPYTVRKTEDNGVLYKFNVSYQATPKILVYAQAASAFRPGGANQVLGLPSSFTPYDPDHLWTYEGGFKSTLFDGTLLLNASAYLTNWSNLQVTGTSGTFSFLTNAGDARVKGVEIEAVVEPLRGLQFSGNVNLLSAKLTEDQINNLVLASGRKGDRIPQSPNQTFTLAGQYDWDVTASVKGLVRADINYVGRSYADFRPTAITYRKIGGYEVVGARAGIHSERWGAYLFVNNLFDVIARTTAANVLGGSLETITAVPPRTIGVNLTTSF